LAKSDEYDGNYAPDTVDTTKLNRNLFATLVEALIVIGLNNSITASNVENEVLPASYKAPLDEALATAKGVTGSSSTAGSSAGSASASATTGTFDGTSVNNETELAKIISGLYIKKNTAKSAVDSIDKVKALYDKDLGSGKFDQSVQSLPWKKGTTKGRSNKSFDTLQYQALKTTAPMPYGPSTADKFKELYDAAGF